MHPDKYRYVLGHYILKFIPMINCDGVVIGNSRNSLVGVDLNRRWNEPNPLLHPEVYFTKIIMLEQSQTKRGISIFCDLHGHNKKENCFFFGCSKASDEAMISWTKTRLLPKILASNEPIFDYNSCRFSQEKSKLTTARVVVWNEMKVTNSFTLEISMYGKYIQKSLKNQANLSQALPHQVESIYEQFQEGDFLQLAINLVKSIGQYTLIVKQLEKIEWLKPSLLKGIAGVAARDKTQVLSDSTQLISNPKSGIKSKTQRIITSKKSSFIIGNKNQDQKNDQESTQIQENLCSTENLNLSVKKQAAVRKFQSSKLVIQPPRESVQEEPQTEIKSAVVPLGSSSSSSYTEHNSDQEEVEEQQSWKQFFEPDEIKSKLGHIIDEVRTGGDMMDSDAASDSQPSCDNFDETDYCDFFQKALKNSRKNKIQNKQKKLSQKMPKPIIKLQVLEQEKILVKKKPSNLSDVTSPEALPERNQQQDQKQRHQLNEKQRIHPTFLNIESMVEKQLGIPESIVQKDTQILQLPTNFNKVYSFKQQGVIHLSKFNSRQPNLENLQAAIDKLASPMTLIPSELRPVGSRNQKQRETKQQYILDQNLQQQTQLLQLNSEKQRIVSKLKSSQNVQNNPSIPISPINQFGKTAKQNTFKQTELHSPNPGSKTNQSAEQAQSNFQMGLPKVQKPETTVDFGHPHKMKQQFEGAPAILQVLSPKRPSNVPGQKLVHQNIQQISNSIVINNYYQQQAPQVKKRTQRQINPQNLVPIFEAPFEVTSLTKKPVEQAVAQNQTKYDNRDYFSETRPSRIIQPENITFNSNSGYLQNRQMQGSFAIKRKKH